MEKQLKLLPRGIQDFEEMRNGGYHYVDKTDMVWEMANTNKFCFLSRPRRFGKSLLASTLHCYFAGKKELFEGLKISQMEKDWPVRQVFHFDFSGISTARDLLSHLNARLADYERIYGRYETDQTLKDRMLALMREACGRTGQQVAVLVDEYDAPLQNTLFTPGEHDELKTIYRDFFPCFKTGSHLLKCLFLTGIMKFTQLSLFSVLNTVVNLSFDERYATLCGITKEELTDEFGAELDLLAQKQGTTQEGAMREMEALYDGYHFAADGEGVFNPYSVINALSTRKLGNFWISSGGSQMLSEMLERYGSRNDDYDGSIVDCATLEESDANASDVSLFLYQAGYLTIKGYDGDVYTLGFPNREVRQALYDIVLPNALAKSVDEITNCTTRIKSALNKTDIEMAMQNLQAIVAGTPYSHDNTQKAFEERFVFILKHILYLCKCELEEERHVAKGRIDLVAHHPKCILVMEMKMDNNGGEAAAEKQIGDRRYADAYMAESKPVFAIAVEFSAEQRGISGYRIKKVK